jgi:hypothetical protein
MKKLDTEGYERPHMFDGRSNARLVLDAYELIGEVVHRHLAIIDEADKREINARNDWERQKATNTQNEEDDNIKPLETAGVALLKALAIELNKPYEVLGYTERRPNDAG